MDLLSMPRLGQTMDAGVVVARHVEEGASFFEGDPLFTVETEKVETEVEAKADGRLLRWLVADGAEVAVGTPVAVLGGPTEEVDAASIDSFLRHDAPSEAESSSADPPQAVPESTMSPTSVKAMPRARALAKEAGLDLSDVAAGGDGSVTVADVEAYIARRRVETVPPSDGPQVTRIDGHRRAMVASMTASWATIPHFTELVEVDASALLSERQQHPGPDRPPTVTAYLIREFARACRTVPLIHAGLVAAGLLERERVDMAVAVDTPQGLVAPVMRGVDQLDVHDIAARLADLADRARGRRLTIADVEGGHVALSNLGAYGVHAGTPIIPPQHTAMLFCGAIVERPVVVAGEIVVRPMMWLSLTCDHRLIDGATAARALQALRASIESTASD